MAAFRCQTNTYLDAYTYVFHCVSAGQNQTEDT